MSELYDGYIKYNDVEISKKKKKNFQNEVGRTSAQNE
jgi:hypothetical protein